jgi:beta-glucanase (GH16 family)
MEKTMRFVTATLSLLLMSGPAVLAKPNPKVLEAEYNDVELSSETPGTVEPGETIWFEVKAANTGSILKGHGGIGISIPGFPDVAGHDSESLTWVEVVAAGDEIPGSPSEVLAEHVIVYGDRTWWKKGQEASLRVAINAPDEGHVDFHVRAAFFNGDWDPLGTDPASGSTKVTDQQGYSVYVYRIDVLAPPQPDLTVISVAVDGDEVVSGQAASLIATLANIGDAPVSAGVKLEYLMNGQVCDTDTLSAGLGAGTTAIETSEGCIPDSAGDQSFSVRIDSSGTVPESNEDNNELTIVVPVIEDGPFCAQDCVDQQEFTDQFESPFYGLLSSNGIWKKSTQSWFCSFMTEQVLPADGTLKLQVPAGGATCGSVVSDSGDFYYGSYRASIKPAAESGVCGAFFLYNSDVQEIDIEILSQEDSSLRRVHFVTQPSGFLPCGSAAHKCHDLPEVPSSGFHEYGFDWYPDRVEFYVDGQKVGETTENVPTYPGHLILSNWAGNPLWTGPLPTAAATMEVDYVTYKPFDYCPVCPGCGNGQVTLGEECDGSSLSGWQCQDAGYIKGEVACTDQCDYDLSGCSEKDPCAQGPGTPGCEPICGDGLLDADEECDGAPAPGITCTTLGWDGGTVGCSEECELDSSDCFQEKLCGNGEIDPDEECDGDNVGGQSCGSLGFSKAGQLACTLDCMLQTADCKPMDSCGNGQTDEGEECDRDDLSGASCQTLGFATGELVCSPTCDFDSEGCLVGYCGDDKIDRAESCDGEDLAGQSCHALGYAGGSLHCLACKFDTSDCEAQAAQTIPGGKISHVTYAVYDDSLQLPESDEPGTRLTTGVPLETEAIPLSADRPFKPLEWEEGGCSSDPRSNGGGAAAATLLLLVTLLVLRLRRFSSR